MNSLNFRLTLFVFLYTSQLYSQLNFSIYEESIEHTYYGGEVKIISLSENGNDIGQAVWLDRNKQNIKTKYLAAGANVYDRFKALEKSGVTNLISVCSGAYSTNYNQKIASPVGICVDNGTIVNRTYDNKMDALVIVESTGGIRVTNIEEKNLKLLSINKTVDVSDNFQRSTLLNWAETENATVFQTHLLVWKNSLQLNISKADDANVKTRRRILASVYDSNNELRYVIFNIKKPSNLGSISSSIFRYLNEQKKCKNIVSVLNLDTGAYDIFSAFDAYGNPHKKYEASENITKATNLIIFHRPIK